MSESWPDDITRRLIAAGLANVALNNNYPKKENKLKIGLIGLAPETEKLIYQELDLPIGNGKPKAFA